MPRPRRSTPSLALVLLVLGCPGGGPVDAVTDTDTDTSPGASTDTGTGTGAGTGTSTSTVEPNACVPGQSIPCTCTGPDIGVQVCRSDGSGYDACICASADGSTTTGSATSTGDTTDADTGPLCGDRTVDPGEDCDDGEESEACNADCTLAACGDGLVNATAGEDCDDGEESEACNADCTLAACGDAWINAAAGEVCDGDELAGVTCEDLGLPDGALSCAPGCADYDIAGCYALPAAPMLALAISPIKRFDFSWSAVTDAVYYQLEESVALGEPFVPLGGDVLGTSVSHEVPLHFRWQARYRLRACNPAGCTTSAVVDVVGSLVEGVGYVKASNTDAEDFFGESVALSGDGSTLAVGAIDEDGSATGIDGDQSSDANSSSGAVYVYTRDALGTWTQQAYVKASNTGTGDQFGMAVALSHDGHTLVVGAPAEDGGSTGIGGDQANNGASQSGAVYVFVRDGAGTWSQQAYAKASNTDAGDAFGSSVTLSDDGDTLAVGAPAEDGGSTGIDGDQTSDAVVQAGAAYVFVRNGAGVWTQQAYVKASNTGQDDDLGYGVALSGDGDTLAVGAFGERSSATGIDGDQTNDAFVDAGAVFVFVRDGAGTWSQQAYVKASNTDAYDRFGGRGLALSTDGDTLAVGAHQEDSIATGIDGDAGSNAATNAGAAYVFVRDGAGTWAQQAYVKSSNPDISDAFGGRLDLSADGNVLAVSAYSEGSNATGLQGNQANDTAGGSGAVYVFVRDGAGAWAQQTYVKASNTDVSDRFGVSLSLSADAGVLAVGAYEEDGSATGIGGNRGNDGASNAGAVYLY